jgi:hypothetical protein
MTFCCTHRSVPCSVIIRELPPVADGNKCRDLQPDIVKRVMFIKDVFNKSPPPSSGNPIEEESEKACCLSQGLYFCTNIMTKKQVGEERVYSAYTSMLLFITKEVRTGTQAGQKAGADEEAIEGCYLLACSACSLIEPKTTSPEMVPPTRGLSP